MTPADSKKAGDAKLPFNSFAVLLLPDERFISSYLL